MNNVVGFLWNLRKLSFLFEFSTRKKMVAEKNEMAAGNNIGEDDEV